MTKAHWPAPDRNKQPILDVLQRVLPRAGTLLEIGSGSGQHAVFFAARFPRLTYVPSDVDPENLASIRAWAAEAKLENLRPPLVLDVTAGDFGLSEVDAVYCANVLHITPWSTAEGLFAGVGRCLSQAGVLVLYGPYRVDGAHTAPSNEAFDANLRERDPSWGVRDVEAVLELATAVGLSLVERVPMPANNQTLVFRRRS
jgi:SAM-dependent methyltransferase